jgi:hypothetical protein
MVRTRPQSKPQRKRLLAFPVLAALALAGTACSDDMLVDPDPGEGTAAILATEKLLITPTGLEFGNVQVGQTSPAQVVVVRNVSTASLVLSGTGGTAAAPFAVTQNCQDATLAPGDTCQMSFTFAPTAAGAATATVTGTWNGESYTIQLHGTGGGGTSQQLFVSPTSLSFGEVAVGSTSAAQTVTVRNAGSTPVVLALTGGTASAPFATTQSCNGTTLAAGATCDISFTFAPTATGAAAATVTGSWNGAPFSIGLAGTGIAAGATPTQALRITPTGLEFGTVAAGTTSPAQAVTVTNVTSAAVTLSGTGGTPTGPFATTNNCQGMSLAAGASCQMQFTFTPTTSAEASGTATGAWNGQSYTISLHGNGGGGSTLLITPTGLDFGEIRVGTTSPTQAVIVTNVSTAPIALALTGGTVAAPFAVAQSCQGTTLAPGATCTVTYSFAPTALGVFNATSSGSWNGVSFEISLTGAGIPSFEFDRVRFLPPIGKRSKVNSGSALPVKFVLSNEDGETIPDSDGKTLADACRIRVRFEGTSGTGACASHGGNGRFSHVLKTSKSMSAGTHDLIVEYVENGTVFPIGSVEIVIF